MPSAFGITPPEPPAIRTLEGVAPLFAEKVEQLLANMAARGLPTIVREALRTVERQAWLYGIGRDYDPDGRGIVTSAKSAEYGWHVLGLAADLVHERLEDNAPSSYWDVLAQQAEALGLVSGRRWTHFRNGEGDKPHVHWGDCPASPADSDRVLFHAQGRTGTWKFYGAS